MIQKCVESIQTMPRIEKIRILSRKGKVEIDRVTGVQAQR
ncbi:hypothetical protein BRO54_1380 [Geobacillus proteiniphilus]|uniref:Uncharacterized protein n=1 Tax=Geobacillus proteiniphilus TaxID=860353 RepID=A0A1Q5T3U1_9BACL|nr:Type III restriction-modification system restriction subunit [Geobacillus sp. WSUCF1]OKO94825.1 hypothetical protein BRO54_1380 [Geobacillus proteiniphilus]